MAICLLSFTGGCNPSNDSSAVPVKELVFLAWSLDAYHDRYREMIAEFEAQCPGYSVKLLDKRGSEWPAYFQTVVIAGKQPDIVDVQGLLWVEYAKAGLLMDLAPMLAADPAMTDRFHDGALAMWTLEDKVYMLPFYFVKSLLIYNKEYFRRAGLQGPPGSFDELLTHAELLSVDGRAGLITLNIDWVYWVLFDINGVSFFSEDMKSAAFNTPQMLEALTRLAAATRSGHIDKLSWTGRWVEPNSSFAAGNAGMHHASTSALFWSAANSSWMNADSVGIAQMPGGASVPSTHGYGISSSTKYPEAAWEFVKIATSDRWQAEFASSFSVLTLNEQVDAATIKKAMIDDPIKARALTESLKNFDRFTGNWKTPLDALLRNAFYPPIQAALLGQKDPATAIREAEVAVNRVLTRVRK